MAAVDPSTTAFITIHNMATWMLGTWGGPAVRERWGAELTSGRKLASYCLTEPGAGSDAASLKTRAELQGGEYVINGGKAFISGAGSTDVLVLMARTGGSGAGGVSAFAVPADAPGIRYGKKEHKMGWNSQPTRTIDFDDVRVPAENLLGSEGEGFRIAMKGLDGGRINIATCSVGAAQGALDAARRYLHERQQFGKPLASFQALQFKLADMATHAHAARLMLYDAAAAKDAGQPFDRQASMAKLFASERAMEAAHQAIQIHGGYGIISEYPVSRAFGDAKVLEIVEGTSEIQRMIISRALLN